MNTPPPRPPAFRGQLKTLRRRPRSCRSFSPPSGDRHDSRALIRPGDADPPPLDVRGIGGISEAAAPAPADFDAVSEAADLTRGVDLACGTDLACGVDELPCRGEEAGAASDLADTAVLPIVRFRESKGRVEERAGDAKIQGATKRRSFASLALAPGTGEDVAAFMGGVGKRRWRLNRDNARAVLIAVAVRLIAAWAWLALTKPGRDESQSELVEERGSTSTFRGVGRGKASDSTNSCETRKKSTLESRGGGEPGSGSAGGLAGFSSIVVYVSGAIEAPGVYTLAAGSRVDDAVRAAGGLTERAESAGTNLAAQLSGGEHVHVAATGESAPSGALGPPSGSDAAGGKKNAGISGKGAGKEAATGQKTGTAKVNVSTVGAEELQTLPGVGPAMAKTVIAWREENGRFRSVNDLFDISGIDKATLAKFRDRVSV